MMTMIPQQDARKKLINRIRRIIDRPRPCSCGDCSACAMDKLLADAFMALQPKQDTQALVDLWREIRQSYRRGPVILAHVMDIGSKLADALEALSESSVSSETPQLPNDCTLTPEQASDALSHVGWCEDCRAYFDGRAGCPTDIRSDEREKAERVANGLETALSFTSRLLLDTAVRESIKELRTQPAAQTQEERSDGWALQVRRRLIERWKSDPSLEIGVPYRRMASDVAEVLGWRPDKSWADDAGYPEELAPRQESKP